MTATASQINQLRRMVDEPTATTTTYTDNVLAEYIERYPLLDANGVQWYVLNTATMPPTQTANTAWMPTYDLAAAAADIWSEKAAPLSADYDFNADGANFSRSQAYQQALSQARYWSARRSARTFTLVKWPKETTHGDFPWLVNLAEERD